MVRFKPVKRRAGLTESARTRQAREAQERVRATANQHPHPTRRPPVGEETEPASDAVGSGSHTSAPEDVKLVKLAAQVRYVLLVIALVMLLWFIVAMQDRDTWGPEMPMPTWALDIAALSPLLVLIRFWSPETRKRSVTLEFDLRVFSGLYFVMAILGTALGGYWQLWPGVLVSVAVHAGIWYTNRQMRSHG